MTLKKRLEKFIRGWLPKETDFALAHKTVKPRWWRPLWIVTVLGPIVSGLVSFLIFNVPLERVIAFLFFAFASLGFAYYIRVRPSIKVNRAVYIILGISPIGFGLSLAWMFTIGRYIIHLLGIWGFLIGLIVPCTIGAFIGDRIGKRRNYQLPLSLQNV
jgi:hypothetical protein